MWGTFPVVHWLANRVSSSRLARWLSRCARPSAINALSQLHWWGYREGPGLVQFLRSLRRSTPAASGLTSVGFSRVGLDVASSGSGSFLTLQYYFASHSRGSSH